MFNFSLQSNCNFRKKGDHVSLLEISNQLSKFIWNFRRVGSRCKNRNKIIEISFDLRLECICFGLVGSHLPIVNKIECFINSILRSKTKMRALVKRNPDVGYEFDENTEILLRFQIIWLYFHIFMILIWYM